MAVSRISDVANKAGVSAGTVSNFYNHPERVLPATRARIKDAIEELGFRRNHNASVLAGAQNNTIGLVITGFDHGQAVGIANGASSAASEHGYDLLVASTSNDRILENRYIDYFEGVQISGIIIAPRAEHQWTSSIRVSVPTVIVDYESSDEHYCYVSPDNEQVGVIAARHAIELGRHRILVVSASSDVQALTDRWNGISNTFKSTDSVTVELLNASDWGSVREGFLIGQALADRPLSGRPDFVIGLTDILAAGIVEGLRSGGIAVPDGIAVMGCDGNPMVWGGSMTLTTIAPRGWEMGNAAVTLLSEEIEQENKQGQHYHKTIKVSGTIMPRESTIGTVAPLTDIQQLPTMFPASKVPGRLHEMLSNSANIAC